MIYSYYPDPKIVEEKTYRYIELFQFEMYSEVEIEEFKGDYYRIFMFTIKRGDEKETKRIVILNSKPKSLFEETEITIVTIDPEETKTWKDIVYEDIVSNVRIEREVIEEEDDEVLTVRTTYKLVF
jgi:hypothetical protein